MTHEPLVPACGLSTVDYLFRGPPLNLVWYPWILGEYLDIKQRTPFPMLTGLIGDAIIESERVKNVSFRRQKSEANYSSRHPPGY